MRCAQASRQLQLYIDKRLPIEHLRSLEAHLADCPPCREELFLLEEIDHSLYRLDQVVEPPGLTRTIMQRVAFVQRARNEKASDPPFILFRPSLVEVLVAVLLATVATCGIMLGQPSLRAMLPFGDGHNALSHYLLGAWNTLMSMNTSTLTAMFWIVGTILGIWITLLVAGQEMRSRWLKEVRDSIPF